MRASCLERTASPWPVHCALCTVQPSGLPSPRRCHVRRTPTYRSLTSGFSAPSIVHQYITDRLSTYVCMYLRALSVPRLDVDGGKKRNQTRREGAIHRARPPGMMHVYSEQNGLRARWRSVRVAEVAEVAILVTHFNLQAIVIAAATGSITTSPSASTSVRLASNLTFHLPTSEFRLPPSEFRHPPSPVPRHASTACGMRHTSASPSRSTYLLTDDPQEALAAGRSHLGSLGSPGVSSPSLASPTPSSQLPRHPFLAISDDGIRLRLADTHPRSRDRQ